MPTTSLVNRSLDTDYLFDTRGLAWQTILPPKVLPWPEESQSRRPDTTPGAPAGSTPDARDVRYEYDAAGQLRRIVDNGANQITENAYDAMGRHVRESLTQGGTVIRDTRIGYDALGRLSKVSDPGQYTKYSFDANGNRRRGLTQYVDNGGATRMADNWYTYDRENRITLTQGELVDVKNAQGVVTGQQIRITARQGQQLAYDMHGNRRSATGMGSGGATTEFYTYDDDNRLIGTYRGGLMASGRAYDGAGRMTDYITYTAAGAIDSRRENLYFDNGWMKQQNLYGGGGGLNQRTDYSAANAYDKVGNLLNYNVGVYGGTSYTNYYTYTYTKFDDYKEVKVAGSSSYFLPGETNTSYDVNGHIAQVIDSQQQWVADGEYGYYALQTTRTRSFIGDADGTILRKTDNGNVQNLFYAGDKAIGSVGGTAASPVADFDFNFAPVSDSYPAVSPGNYTVVAGDTLRGIAYKAWGDGKLWYLIADANGLMTDGDMHVGQALKIPNRISNLHNDFQTNKVYNAAEIIGDITPTLPDPPPPPQSSGGGDGGCGGFGSVLIMVVAIVAAAWIGPQVLAAIAPEAAGAAVANGFAVELGLTAALPGATAGQIAVATGIGASVGNLAGQVVGNLAGIQDGINFGDIALAGLSAGLGSLAGSALGVGSIENTFLREAVGGALRSTINQGLNLLTGHQQAFNWEQVAANAVAQGVAAQAVSNLPVNDALSRTLLSSITRGAVSSAFNSGGRFQFANVAADLFGNVLGYAQAFASSSNASQQTEKLDQEAARLQRMRSTFADASVTDVPVLPMDEADTPRSSGGVGRMAPVNLSAPPQPGVWGMVRSEGDGVIRSDGPPPTVIVTPDDNVPVLPEVVVNGSASGSGTTGGTYGQGIRGYWSAGEIAANSAAGAIAYAIGGVFGKAGAGVADSVSFVASIVSDRATQRQVLSGLGYIARNPGQVATSIYGSAKAWGGKPFSEQVRDVGEFGGEFMLGGGISKGLISASSALGSLRVGARIDTLLPAASERIALRSSGPRLLPGEGMVGTYDDLIAAGTKGDNITPHHIPSENRMALAEIPKGDGIAINMEQPFPGVGGRHRATFTYGTKADIDMTARDALAAGVWDARRIYRADGLYTPQIRSSLQDLIQMNKINHSTIFVKPRQ